MASMLNRPVARFRLRPAATALTITTCLILSACADDGSGAAAQGSGVDFGASKEEYQKALADMEPIELEAQTLAPFDAPNGRPYVAYWDAVEEWSGGKIIFNRTPNSGISPLPEAFESLNDGRLDMTTVLPSYSPKEFPVNTAISELSFVGTQRAIVSDLVNHAVATELALDVAPEAITETEDLGTHLLVPNYSSGTSSWACSEDRRSVADFDGAIIRAGDTGIVPRIEAVGAEATFLAVAEIFEGLQRGVVDCANGGLQVHQSFGYLAEAPNLIIDDEVALGRGFAAVGISRAVWDDLPLAAKQLLFDRIDVFLEENFLSTWQAAAESIDAAKASGGTVGGFDDDAQQVIAEANDEITEEMRQDERFPDPDATVTSAIESAEEWEKKVADLGYDYRVGYDEFSTWFSRDKVDLQPYLDALFEDVLNSHRPE
jgi:TRAP-type C4-dicarboxylate transport system substrate-binding protein